MPNRYANLTPSKWISQDFQKITTGFDTVQAEMDAKPDASIAQVNDIAMGLDGSLTVEAGAGITVTTTPAEKKLRITATGASAPGAHGSEHNSDGSDPIPEFNYRQLENIGYGVQSGLNALASATPNMNVNVQTGVAYISDGRRLMYNTITQLAVTASDATNPRKDIVYLSATGVTTYLAGTPAATPAEPALPANAIKLCVIDVPAADTAIDQTQITDSRVLMTTLAAHVSDFVSISQFPLIIPEVDDTARLQRAIDSVGASKKKLRLLAGVYTISSKLSYITDNILTSSFDRDGIQIEGEVGTIIKASDTFPTDSVNGVMLDLDGNPTESVNNLQARVQIGNWIKNIVFDGNGKAAKGIRIRANIYGLYENISFKNVGGGINDAAVYIDGTTAAGKDDADSTLRCIFRNVRINISKGYGVYACNNRVGDLTFEDCSFEFCDYDGMKIAFAGLRVKNCLFASNGLVGTNTGGFCAKKSATGAKNRGLVVEGCTFEANTYYDINVDYCYGYVIDGLTMHPYQMKDLSASADKHALIKLGGEVAESGKIFGIRMQEYTNTYSYFIEGFHFYAGAKDVTVDNISISNITWRTQDHYILDSGATNIVLERSNSSFRATNLSGVGTITQITGDGTEFSTVTLETFTNLVKDYDDYNVLDANGRFVAQSPGLYEFNISWTLTDIAAAHTLIEIAFIKNDAATPVRYLAYRDKIGYVQADKPKFNGSVKLKLSTGDTIIGTVMVSGSTKTVDLVRDTVNDFVFSGNKI